MKDINSIIIAINEYTAACGIVGPAITVSTTDNIRWAIASSPTLNFAIDLDKSDAKAKLTELFTKIKSLYQINRQYKVVFMGKGRIYNFQCEVEATSEKHAKILATSELMAERLSLSNYKSPVISVSRSLQGAA